MCRCRLCWAALWAASGACREARLGSCEARDPGHLVCAGASPSSLPPANLSYVTKVTLCAWPYRTFKVSKHLGHLRELRHLLLTHSAVQRVESFSSLHLLQTVNLTRLQLRELDEEVFSGLSHLTSIDLRHNNLSSLNSSVFTGLPALREIFLIGNNWTCDPGLLWMIANESSSVGSKVQDRDLLYCEGKTKTRPKPLVQVMKFVQVMQSQCPPPCNCSVVQVVKAYYSVAERGKLVPYIKVNCNRRNLTAMPATLPDFTTAVYLRGNNLTTVEELVFNPHYKKLREIYLDNNQITSINILEGSYFLKHFGILNLRNNRLRQIPLYALDHALEGTHGGNLEQIYLGNNPWRCDCKFTIHFLDFIRRYNKKIRDKEDIRCESIEGNENSDKMITELSRKDLCQDHSVKLRFIDKLNIFLACMNVLVISVFLFNLTVYKTTGRLPWMVAKFF